MEKVDELIFRIYETVALHAMEHRYSVTLRREKNSRGNKSFILDSSVNENSLTLSAYPIDEEEKTLLYADGEPVSVFSDTNEEEEEDGRNE